MVMTRQQTFDKVLNGLRAQGVASTSSLTGGGESCRYRGSCGRRCAAGLLIKDEHYCPEMEGRNVGAGLVYRALMDSGVDVKDIDTMFMVTQMQSVHDRWMPRAGASDAVRRDGVARWESAMEAIAREAGVQYTPPPVAE